MLQYYDGATRIIKKIYLSYRMSTTYTHRGVPSLYADGSKVDGIEHATYVGKDLNEPGYMSTTLEFEVDGIEAYVLNEDVNNYVIWLTDITIEYSIVPSYLS